MTQDTHFHSETGTVDAALRSRCVMGILNVTPDSFYDGGKYADEISAVRRAMQMAEEGAAIIDIGAVSTRPGSLDPGAEEEWKRLEKIIPAVKKELPGIFISVDTFHSEIAKRVLENGADIINDISGGMFDSKMHDVVASADVPYVLMHIRGTPAHMQEDPQYENVVSEVKKYFEEKIPMFRKTGGKKIILDPGFGFGKTLDHNLELLHSLKEFSSFGFPILAGISRKSMVTQFFNVKKENALEGTIALNKIALENGANILRVHDVKEHVELIDTFFS
ncbi:MAG: dihydropteroate synthase [Bacteroidetes bacterium]|nr:dihydropteroate synthase [Bacteroidota bacterium]